MIAKKLKSVLYYFTIMMFLASFVVKGNADILYSGFGSTVDIGNHTSDDEDAEEEKSESEEEISNPVIENYISNHLIFSLPLNFDCRLSCLNYQNIVTEFNTPPPEVLC